ncbi:MAG: phage tail protein [Alphaproteobacteria bacterium]|nr:MAG: phage tail protein [Alphaproteobacteria bacterium]
MTAIPTQPLPALVGGVAQRLLGGTLDPAGLALIHRTVAGDVPTATEVVGAAPGLVRAIAAHVNQHGGTPANVVSALAEIAPAAAAAGLNNFAPAMSPVLAALTRTGLPMDAAAAAISGLLQAVPGMTGRIGSDPVVATFVPQLTQAALSTEALSLERPGGGFVGFPAAGAVLQTVGRVGASFASAYVGRLLPPAARPLATLLIERGANALVGGIGRALGIGPGPAGIGPAGIGSPWRRQDGQSPRPVDSSAPWALLGRGNDEARFRLLYGWQQLQATEAEQVAEHALAGGAPLLQSIGPSLDSLSVEITLDRAWCDPSAELDRLRRQLRSRAAQPLVYGNGLYRGRFVLLEIQSDTVLTTQTGSVERMDLSLKLRQSVEPPGIARVRPVARPLAGAAPPAQSRPRPTVETNSDGFSMPIARRPGAAPAAPPTPPRPVEPASLHTGGV